MKPPILTQPKNPIKCMCGHELVSIKEQCDLLDLVVLNNWDFDRQFLELDKIMQANGDKFHK